MSESVKNGAVVPQLNVEFLNQLQQAVHTHNNLVKAGFDGTAKLSEVQNLLKRILTNVELVQDELDKLPPGRPNFGTAEDREAAFFVCTQGGELTEDQLLLMAAEYGMEAFVFTDKTVIKKKILKLVPADVARRYQVVPVMIKEKTLVIAITNPTDLETLDSMRFILKKDIAGVLVTKSDLKKALDLYYPRATGGVTSDRVFLEPPSERVPFIGGNHVPE
ncbi:MAG: hypothetical protein WCO30_02755 [bacterium]